MLKKTLTWFGLSVALGLFAAPAHAGGVIIDGWEDPSVCNEEMCTMRRDNQDASQEFYLLAAFVLHGHDAVAAREGGTSLGAEDFANDTADESEIGVDDPDAPLPSAVLEELEGQELGGCAAAPGGLAALAGLLLLRRRRR